MMSIAASASTMRCLSFMRLRTRSPGKSSNGILSRLRNRPPRPVGRRPDTSPRYRRRSAGGGELFFDRIEDFGAWQEGVVAQDHANAIATMRQRQLEPKLDEMLLL